jgi:hypothetical protein
MQRNEGGTSTGEVAELHGEPVGEPEVQQALDAILRSAAFQRSERLPRFLRFVCEHTLRGESSRINEYLIGAEVFGRGADYSPHEDGIVRRQAHALRRKLQEYYENEGHDDPIHIELPVGRYVPVFRRIKREAEPIPVIAPAAVPTAVPKAAPNRWLILSAAAIGAFAVGWVVGNRTIPAERSALDRLPPAVRDIWGRWLEDPTGPVICFSNPLTTVVKHFQEPLPVNSQPPRMRLTPEQEKFFRSVVPLTPGGYLYFAPAISQAKMGEAIAAVHLSNLFAGVGRSMRATQSRFLSWEDLTQDNFILLGHNEANAWLDRILDKYPFKLTATRGDKQRAIVNTQPAPGETKQYEILYADGDVSGNEEYALISMIPGVDGRHRLLLINGLNTQATQSAAEYLTTPGRLHELESELRKQAASHGPEWNFQAVLRTEVHDRVPTRASLVALKVIQPR